MTLVDRVRQAYNANPVLGQLIDESVARFYNLTRPEVKALGAILVAGEPSAALRLAEREGLDDEMFEAAVWSLQKKQLLAVVEGQFDLSKTERALRVERPDELPPLKLREAPQTLVVPRPLRETVAALARSEKSPAAGLGAVYSFLYGRRVQQREWGMLGKIANLLGAGNAALLLLESAHKPFNDENPIAFFLAQAQARAKTWRPEGAPDPEEQRAERSQIADAAWQARMSHWLSRFGEAERAIKAIDEWEYFGVEPYQTPEQFEAARRQIRLDFERWTSLGKPQLTNTLQ
jgi:hypothetical protein